MEENNLENVEHRCTLKEILDIMGGKWAIPIIYSLLEGTKRFKELERTIPNINTRMLVKELKNIEANEILKRVVYATVPPTVEYTLTLKGKKLRPVIDELRKWGEEFAVK
ncbi:MAG: winged helix-turn-helix transcriptional regulator [Cytophagaceae bacterium]|nr:winged helix-turn-helix transcriptional regulator [Cytophagaceae bacterium]